MTKEELFAFLQRHRLAVLATVSPSNQPEAAVMGYAVTSDLEIVFDTVRSARKYANMLANPRVALVIGWDQVTLQYEGVAEEPTGERLDQYKEIYFGTYPDGRERQAWTGITWFKVRPTWIRYSDFNEGSRQIAEFDFPAGGTASTSGA